MAVDREKTAIALLATTDGRDKLLKGFAQVAKLLSMVTGVKTQAAVAGSVNDCRSLLRVAGFLAHIVTCRGKVLRGETAPQDLVLMARLAGDGIFGFLDTLAFLGKNGFLLSKKAVPGVVKASFDALFYGFLLATILDIMKIRQFMATNKGTEEDMKTRNALFLTLLRDVCDTVFATSAANKTKMLKVTPFQSSILLLISACIATYENWNKNKVMIKAK